jgi:hypothetical protein
VVTGDAIYTTPEICRAIVDSGGDYLLVVKDSNRDTKEAIADEFLPAFSPPLLSVNATRTSPLRG